MPKSIGNQLQEISRQALNENNLFKLQIVPEIIHPSVKKIANLLNVHWAFRLGQDAYPKTLENASLEEIEWCMKQIIYTQLSLKEAFAGLHGGYNPQVVDVSAYDRLFAEISNQHDALYRNLNVQRNTLLKEISSNNGHDYASCSGSYSDLHIQAHSIDTFDFLIGMMDAANGHPSDYVFFAGNDYFAGYVTEVGVQAAVKGASLVIRGISAGLDLTASAIDAGLDRCVIDEDCCKCCGGGCFACAGSSAKAVATAGGGAATIGAEYVDPISATQAATAHHAGMFSHAAWSKFFAPTIGSAATLLYTCVTGLPVLYNFMHSLYGKLVKGGEREKTASRDRWAGAQDLTMSLSTGAILSISFLALLGPHAAVTMLILGMFAGDRGSKYMRRSNEREAMGGIHKPQKWVPTTARLASLCQVELKAEDPQSGSANDAARSAFMRRFNDEQQIEAAKVYHERKQLEDISRLHNSCYNIAQREKAIAQANTNCYSSLFSHYNKTEKHVSANRHVDKISKVEEGESLALKCMSDFVELNQSATPRR